MSWPFSLDSLDPLYVINFSGFDLPDDVTTVGILGDGTSAFNAVLQSPGTKLPVAQLDGVIFDPGDVATFRALRQAEALVSFVEPLGPHTVLITQLAIKGRVGGPWEWNATLVEQEAVGS